MRPRCQGERGVFLSFLPHCMCRDRLPELGGPDEAGSPGVTYGAIKTVFAESPPPPGGELGGGLGFFPADQAAALTPSQHLQWGVLLCTPAPPSSSGLIYYISAFGRPAPPQKQLLTGQASGRRAGLAMTHALSVECSLFKGLAGEGAKFKARLPEKITCHVKIAAV